VESLIQVLTRSFAVLGLENVTPKDADDIIEFMREYLHHVYVMPAKLAARKAAPALAAPATGKP